MISYKLGKTSRSKMACLFYMRDTSFFFRQQISLVQIKTMCVGRWKLNPLKVDGITSLKYKPQVTAKSGG